MIDYKTFPTIVTTDGNHPRGKIINESFSNSGDGTIVRAEFLMDLYSFIFGLMIDQNVEANGNEEYTETNELGNKQVWSVMEEFARPTGMIFTDYPRQPASLLATLYPNLIFTNVSASYAGYFFRVEGSGAARFGTAQTDTGREITGSFGCIISVQTLTAKNGFNLTFDRTEYPPEGAFGVVADSGAGMFLADVSADIGTMSATAGKSNFAASRSWGATHVASEFRPKNYAIRIQKKTGVRLA